MKVTKGLKNLYKTAKRKRRSMKKIITGDRLDSPFSANIKPLIEKQNEQFKKLCADKRIEIKYKKYGPNLTDELLTIWDEGIDNGFISKIK